MEENSSLRATDDASKAVQKTPNRVSPLREKLTLEEDRAPPVRGTRAFTETYDAGSG